MGSPAAFFGAALIGAALALSGPPVSKAARANATADRAAHLAALPALAGRPVGETDLRGRALLVVFFASWCPGCNDAFEQIRLAHLAHSADGLAVVAVSFGEEARGAPEIREARLAAFLARHQPVFSVVKGSPESSALFGGIVSLPTLFVFGRDGRLRYRFAATDGPEGTSPPVGDLENGIRNALGLGAAERPPALPDSRESAINLQYFNQLAQDRK